MKKSLSKQLVTTLLAFMLCFTLMPQAAFADEAPQAEAQDPEALEAPEGGLMPIEDPYSKIDMISAYDGGFLKLSEGMEGVTVTKPKYGKGLLFTGTVAELKEKITLDAELDLSGNQVGRICVDGLTDKNLECYVNVYLDDEETYAASFKLKNQMGKNAWANTGDRSVDVYDMNIKGMHRISLGFEFPNNDDDDKVSVLLRSIEFAESSIPVMYFNIDETLSTIDAMNASEDHSVECYGTVDLQVPDDFVSEYNGKVQNDLEGVALEYIRGRGNSTWLSDKKPYKVKFDKKQDLFGMGKNKHWILLANRFDNSLIRNRMTYWLGDQFGLEFTPQCIPVEVVMNGEYYGSYLLCEQIRIGSGRVDIDDLEEDEYQQATELPEISGGYLLSLSPYGDEDPDNIFSTSRGQTMFIESPAFEDYTNEVQRNYIKNYVQQTEDAIFGTDFCDEAGTKYTEYLDLDAAANYWWIQEFSSNGDAYGSGSTYLYKKRNGKLFWGPLWDFDFVAWGDLSYGDYVPEELDRTSMPWFDRMKADSEFVDKLEERWTVLDGLLTEITKEDGVLDKYYEQTKTSWKYDNEKYGSYGDDDGIGRSYKEEVDQLRNWVDVRHEAVNENIDTIRPTIYVVTFMIDGKVVKTASVTAGDCVDNFPEAPEKDGYIFKGWESEDWGIIDAYSSILDNLVLSPSYVKESDAVRADKLFFSSYEVYRQLMDWDDYDEFMVNYTIIPYDSDETQVTWTSSDPSIATVDHMGTVKFKAPGTVTITGKVGSAENSFTLHVLSKDKNVDMAEYMEFEKDRVTITQGDYVQNVVNVGPQPCYDIDYMLFSLDSDIADIDDNGVITAYKPGETAVIALSFYGGEYCVSKVKVNPVKVPVAAVKPAVSKKQVKVSWKAVKGVTGYKVAYRKAGAKKWTVKSTKKTSYTIKNLKKGERYQIRVRAVGKNGAMSKWSSIKRVYMNRMTASVKPGKKSVTVSWKKNSKASGYQIMYSYSSKMTNAKTISVSKSKTSYKIRNLKKGKKVYVKIRAIRKYSGKKYYGVYSAVKNAKTK